MNTRLIKRLYDEACFEKPYPVQYFNLGLPFFIGPLGQSCDKEIIKVTTIFFSEISTSSELFCTVTFFNIVILG